MGEGLQALSGFLGFLSGVANASQALQQQKAQERLALLQLLGRDPTRQLTVATAAEQQPTNPFQRLLGAGQFQPTGGSPVAELGGTPIVARPFGTEGLPELAATLTPEEQSDRIIQALLRSGQNPQDISLKVAQRREQLQQMQRTGDIQERRLGVQEQSLDARKEEAEQRRAERKAARQQRQQEREKDKAARAQTRALIEQNRTLQQQQIQARIEEQKRKTAGILTPTEQRKTALDLRSNIRQEPAFKDFAGARQAFNVILGGFKRAKEAGANTQQANLADLALISGFARLLDPGSVVRPSEFETVRQSRAVLDRLLTLRARVERGEQLKPKERAEFVRTARAIMREYITVAEKEIGPIYRRLAQSAKIPFRDVFVNPQDVLGGADIPPDDVTTETGMSRQPTGQTELAEPPEIAALRQQFKDAGGTDAEFDAALRGEQP